MGTKNATVYTAIEAEVIFFEADVGLKELAIQPNY